MVEFKAKTETKEGLYSELKRIDENTKKKAAEKPDAEKQ